MALAVGPVQNPTLVDAPAQQQNLTLGSGQGTLQGYDINAAANQQFAGQSLAQNPGGGGGGGGGGGSGGGGGGTGTAGGAVAAAAPPNPLIAQGIQQEYGTAINAGNALYGQNEANLPVNTAALGNYTNAQENAARQQTQGQLDVYGQQAAGVRGQQNLSLAELLDQIRGQHQGLQAQLGAVGAGASSASQLGDIALGKEQGIQTANINQQAGANIANINAQSEAVQKNLEPYLTTIEAYKQQQLNQINQAYQQVKTQLQQALGSAQGEEKFRLGLYAQGLAQTAGQALSDLNSQVTQAKAQVSQQAQGNFLGPQFQALPQQAAPSAIQSTNVSPFNIANPAAGAASNALAGGSLSTLLNKNT